MSLQLLKGIIFFTLSLLTTGFCLPQGLWQNRNSPISFIQNPFNIEMAIKSSLEIPKGIISRFLGTQRDTNDFEEYANGLNKNWINHNNVKKVIAKQPEEDRIYINHNEDYSSTNKNQYRIDKYLRSTDVIINGNKRNEITTEPSEITTEYTTLTDSTEDYETTTFYDGVLNRIGVSALVVATLVG